MCYIIIVDKNNFSFIIQPNSFLSQNTLLLHSNMLYKDEIDITGLNLIFISANYIERFAVNSSQK